MMEPPPALIMWGITYLLASKNEVTLTVSTAFQMASGMSATVVSCA